MTTCVQVVKRIRNNEQCTPSIRDPTNTVILMRFIMLMTHSTQHLFQTLIYIQTLQANESNWSSMFAQKRVLLLNVLRKVIWERVVSSIRLPPFKRVTPSCRVHQASKRTNLSQQHAKAKMLVYWLKHITTCNMCVHGNYYYWLVIHPICQIM